MEMFHEDMCEQWFFDKETKCIYLVSDELDDGIEIAFALQLLHYR